MALFKRMANKVKWRPKDQAQKKSLILFVILFAAIGGYAIIKSFALAPDTFTGEVVAVIGDDFKNNRSDKKLHLRQDDGQLKKLQNVDEKFVGKRVKINGKEKDNIILAAGGNSTQTTSGTTTTTTAPLSGKKAIVILFNFTDDTSQPFTPSEVNNKFFASTAPSVATYFKEVSHDQLQLTGDVKGWYTIPYNKSDGCNNLTTVWTGAAESIAAAQGVNFANYTHRVFVFPSVSSCGFAGSAELTGRNSWLNGGGGASTNQFSIHTTAHELGHNFGSTHASSWICRDANGQLVPYSAYCKHNEYGDSYDVMGGPSQKDYPHHIQYWRRGVWGWGSDVQQITTSGTYNLAPAAPSTGAPHSLRIARSDGTQWEVEYRQPYGSYEFNSSNPNYSSTESGSKGILVRQVPVDYGSFYTRLLKANPESNNPQNEFAVGYSFVDEANRIRVTNVGQNSSGAVVKVELGYGLTGDASAPTAPAQLSSNSPITAPNQVALTWTASSDNTGVSSYDVYRDYSTKIATVAGTSYTDTGLNASTKYRYHIIARDAAGNSSVPSVVRVTTGTSTPVAVIITAPQSSQTVSGITQLSFNPATSGFIRGEIKVDSGPWSLTPFSNGDRIDTSLYSNGLHTIYVRSVDSESGLRGPVSTITVNIQNSSNNSIANGSFESGSLDGWTIFNYPRTDNSTKVSTSTPHGGSYAGHIQSYASGGGDSSLEQKVTLPASASLTFWYNIQCNDMPGFGWFTAQILNESGNVIKTLIPKTCTNGQGWKQSQTDLSDLAGQTVLIRFTDRGDYDFQHQTITLIDDVAINTVTSAPSAPTGLSATGVSASQINLTWTASSGFPASYDVYRNGTKIGSSTSTNYSDTGLSAGSYNYYVIAKNSIGSSSPSATVSGTTQTVSLTGTVYSSAGGVVSGAAVSINYGGSTKTVTTTSVGNYSFSNIPAGNYTVSYSASGYKSQSIKVSITSGQTLVKNITLSKSGRR
jgi:M6 family metalloprotease-like protein